MVPNCPAIFLLELMLAQYWQYSRLKITQTIEVIKAPAVQSSHMTMRCSLTSLFNDFSSSLNKHKENNVYQHSQLSWLPFEAIELLVRVLRVIPSITREQQSSIITRRKFRLSQTSRQQYLQLVSATLAQRYSRLTELCCLVILMEAIISIRKVMSAIYPRVQQEQLLSSSKRPMMTAAVMKPSSRSTRGPSRKMVVSIDRNVQSIASVKLIHTQISFTQQKLTIQIADLEPKTGNI